jgi:hypothetical protein
MRATRLSVANYNTTLSSDSLESGTGGSNPLRSTIQSATFGTYRKIAGKARVCAEHRVSLACFILSSAFRRDSPRPPTSPYLRG